MEDRWWDHSPALVRARGEYAEAKRYFEHANRRLTALEDEGIMRGQMWEHAYQQFRHAAQGLTRAHRELWTAEHRLAVPKEYRESDERR